MSMENNKIEIYKNGALFALGGIVIGLITLLLFQCIIRAENLYHIFTDRWPYAALLITPFGFIVIAALIHSFFNGAQGSGIPQVLNALKLPVSENCKPYLSLRILLGKCLMIPAYLCGASLGYEGPAVQIGASLMIVFYERLKIQKEKMRRAMIIAGGAAGLAAAFSAPLTGIVFAIEELSKEYKGKITSYILIAVILAGLICDLSLGHYTYLGHATDTNDSALLKISSYWLIPLCGIIGGGLGSLFSLLLIYCSKKFYHFTQQKPLFVATIAGLLVAIISLISSNQTAGCGEVAVKTMLSGQSTLMLFAPLKMLATLATYLSGIPTGLFAPSIAVGAGFSQLLIPLLPASVNSHALILLMMAAYLCGVIQTPLTSFTVIMEISGQDAMLLPLIATSLIAKLTANLIVKIPLYESLMLITYNNRNEDLSQPSPWKAGKIELS